MSRKTIFTLISGVCVLGFVTVTYYMDKVAVISTLAYQAFSSLKKKSVWTSNENDSSIEDQFGDDLIMLSLDNTTSSRHNSRQQLKNVSEIWNLSSTQGPIGVRVSPDLTTSQANFSSNIFQEVSSNTTTMTFDKTLVVHCMKSPFIVCTPPAVSLKTQKTFRVTFIRHPNWAPVSTFDMSSCAYKQCEFDQAAARNDSDLVVAYGVGLSDTFKPQQRWPHQLYAVSMWESPVHMWSDFITNEHSAWNNKFNLTMSYRVDSDIFSPYYRLKFSPKPLEKRPNYYEIAKNKTRTAVWLVSNCNVLSLRDEYIMEMKQYIDVDIFGKCGRPCSNTSCNNLNSTYKFYLAFENSICTDYVTEKFFKLFVPGTYMIPVVRGGADYDKYFPNYTYINAAHFKTPKDLALYLKALASDLETYSKYLEYKDLYEITGSHIDMACDICTFLHTNKVFKPKTYNLKSWIGVCNAPTDL